MEGLLAGGSLADGSWAKRLFLGDFVGVEGLGASSAVSAGTGVMSARFVTTIQRCNLPAVSGYSPTILPKRILKQSEEKVPCSQFGRENY